MLNISYWHLSNSKKTSTDVKNIGINWYVLNNFVCEVNILGGINYAFAEHLIQKNLESWFSEANQMC